MIGVFFLKLLNISITASWLILAIIIVRLLFRRMPKWINCLLWGIVAFKLCCPFSIESVFSLQPSSEPIKTYTTVQSGKIVSQIPTIDSNSSFVTEKVNPALKKTFEYKGATNSQSALQTTANIAGYIWLSVMIILLLYAIVSIVRMRFKVREAVAIKKNTYLCDTVETPFILGIVRPHIYLPSTLEDEEISYILAHEKAHLKRHDNIWKPLGYVLLSVYWFNPLCIISYLLLCKDIELACDEKVIRDMSFAYKKEYSRVLLACATRRRFVLAYPLAFGEIGVKERIKNVLNYKKRAIGVTILALALGILIAVCFLTNPLSTKTADMQEDSQNDNSLPSEISNEDYKSDKNSSIDDVRLSTYQNSIFLDAFAGYFFESDNYKEPKHGFAPKEWCVLGGIGQCIDSNYEEHEVFSDGNLVECHYVDNHMSVDEMRAFTTDKYSACVYKYEFDLFTAADSENADLTANDPTTSTYWVVFFTEGEGMPLYIKYFNSSYYTMEKAMDSISTDSQQVDGTTDASSTQADEILELRKKLSADR